MTNDRKKKVLTPVGGKDGKTHWQKLGIGFVNDEGQLNVYLDALPTNGKLYICDWEDPNERRGNGSASHAAPPQNRREPAQQDELGF